MVCNKIFIKDVDFMTQQGIIEEVRKYFRIEELVCPHTFNKFGESSWRFLNTGYLHTLLVLRTEVLGVPMTMNDYVFGGNITQRGLRCNLCELVKKKTFANQIYLSAHCLGNGGDAVFDSITGVEARAIIKDKQKLLPYNIRIEKDVSWLHYDTYDAGVKVYEFNG